MTTVIYIRSLLQGGAEKQAILLAEELQKKRPVILVVHTHDENGKHQDFSKIKNIVFLKGSMPAKFLAMVKLLKSTNAINLICYLPVNNIIGAFSGKLARVKNILCGIRGSKSKGFLRTALQKFICNKMNIRFISNSFRSRAIYIAKGFKASQISVIHNGIHIPEINRSISRQLSGQTPNIISVGRFVVEKDLPTLLNALHYLAFRLKFTGFTCTLVGYGPLEEMVKKQIEDLGLNNFIKILPGDKVDLKEIYRQADVYVLTSKYEGMPNTIMEAMSYKLPIISTDAGDAKYLVSTENGCLVKQGDPIAVAIAVKRILEDAPHYNRLSEQSFNIITERFSVSSLAAAYSEYISLP